MNRACRPSPDWPHRTLLLCLVALAGGSAPVPAQDCASLGFPGPTVSNIFSDPAPQALVLGDFYGPAGTPNGVLDAVVARDGMVSLWEGGFGSFPSHLADFPVGSDPRDVVAADFNLDGILDIAVANKGSGTVSVLAGTGTGFGPKVDTAVSTNPERLVVADFDRDGKPDLAVVHTSPALIRVLLGDGNLGFLVPFADRGLPGATAAAAGDFDGNGIVDLVVTQSSFNQVALYLGRGDGFIGSGPPWTTSPLRTVGVGTEPVDIAAGLLDRDGFVDFVTADRTGGTVTVRLGDGGGDFASAETLTHPNLTQPMRVALGDYDRDGVLDVATLDAGGIQPEVLIFPGTGAVSPPPTFDPAKVLRVPFTLTATAWDLAVGDVAIDGRLDVVVAEALGVAGNHITVARNQSGPNCLQTSFGDAPRAYPAGSKPVAVAVADVDEDGIEDLMVAQLGAKQLAFLKGSGNGYGEPSDPLSPPAPLASFVRGIATADFNFDGDADFVAALGESGGGRVQVFLGDGTGTLALGAALADGLNISAVVVGDFDGDGGPDVAATSEETNQLLVFLGRGDGLFDAVPALGVGTAPLAVATGHLNPGTDDFLDLVVANSGSANVSVFTGDGDGSFTATSPVNAGAGSWSVALGRVDGDAQLDLVVANQGSSDVQIFSGNGAGGFAPLVTRSWGVSVPIAVAVFDATDDAVDDVLVVTSAHELHLLEGSYASGFASEETFAVRPRPSQIVPVDADVDGKPDLAIPCKDSHDVVILLARPPGPPAFLTAATVPVEPTPATGADPAGAAAGDFDRDGDVDLAVVNSGKDSITILRNDGFGGFTALPTFPVDVRPEAVVAVDLDLDGILDLAVSCFTAGKVVLLQGDGLLGFGPGVGAMMKTFDVNQTTGLVAGDFDHDGDPDVAAVSKLDNAVQVITNDRNFNFVAGSTAAVGTGPTAIFAADFDLHTPADPLMRGTLDLAVSNGDSNNVTVLYGKTDGTFPLAPAVLPLDPGDTSPLSVTGGDFDRDGDVDVATVAFGGHMLSVFRNDVSGFLASPSRFDASYAPTYVTTGDINRDGQLDLALASSGLKVLRGKFGLAFEDGENFVAGVTPSAVVVADFNRDGLPDAAVVNKGSDTVSILLSTACVRRRLVVTASPNACPAGPNPFAVQATVEVQDDGGNQLLCESGTMDASIAPGTGAGGSLGGTTSVPVVAGVASFNALNVDPGGPRYRLQFDLTGVPAAISRSFSLGPMVTITGLPSVCPATIEPYSVDPGYDTYRWALNGTPFDHRPATELRYVDLTPATLYTLDVEARVDGCLAADNLDVWVGVLDTVTIASAGPFSACVDCFGGTFTVTETGGGVPAGHQWGFRTAPAPGTIITLPAETGDTYVLKGTDFPGPGSYYLVALTTPAAGCGGVVESDEILVTVTASVPGGETQSLGVRSTGTVSTGEHLLQWVNSAGLQDVKIRWNKAPNTVTTCTSPTHPTDVPAFGEVVIPYGGSPPAADQYLNTPVDLDTDYCYSVFARTASYAPGRIVKARAFDSSAGPVKWAYSTGATAVQPPVVGHDGIIALSNDRTVHSLQRGSTGGAWPAAWMPTALTGVAHSRSPIVPFAVPVGSADALLFVGDDEGDVFAIDARTGNPEGGPTRPSPGFGISGAPGGTFTQYSGVADAVVVGLREQLGQNGRLHTLDLTVGSVLGTYDEGGTVGAILGTPSIDNANGLAYFTSYSKTGGPSVWSVQIAGDGSLSKPLSFTPPVLGNIENSPVLRSGRLYASNTAGDVYSIDAASGGDIYSFNTGDGQAKGFLFPDRRNSDLYFATNGQVWAVTDTGTSFATKWTWDASATLEPGPVLYWPGTDMLYVGSKGGRLYQIDWSISPPVGPCTPPACTELILGNEPGHIGAPTLDIGVDPKLLLVGSESGVLYAVEVPF